MLGNTGLHLHLSHWAGCTTHALAIGTAGTGSQMKIKFVGCAALPPIKLLYMVLFCSKYFKHGNEWQNYKCGTTRWIGQAGTQPMRIKDDDRSSPACREIRLACGQRPGNEEWQLPEARLGDCFRVAIQQRRSRNRVLYLYAFRIVSLIPWGSMEWGIAKGRWMWLWLKEAFSDVLLGERSEPILSSDPGEGRVGSDPTRFQMLRPDLQANIAIQSRVEIAKSGGGHIN
ncbi:hypothetical protein K438DRAFT_1937462 [Mycena galopus ATCC 62051]|nr:hypothetical protein K438DRAFT_1937462 [Mycena galopus ATCC 62051]